MKRAEGSWDGMLSGGSPKELVVLLHGLARTGLSMRRMERFLQARGFETCNLSYPSRRYPIEVLSDQLADRLAPLLERRAKLSFVAHSLGGILLRCLATGPLSGRVGRSVMLGPPNQGSEIVDRLRTRRVFKWVNGPAGQQLGTDPESVPNRLGPVDFELGVIAGDRFIDIVFASLFDGLHDGKVAVSRTQVEGMKAFTIVHATHTFMARNREVMENTAAFLKSGRFIGRGEE